MRFILYNAKKEQQFQYTIVMSKSHSNEEHVSGFFWITLMLIKIHKQENWNWHSFFFNEAIPLFQPWNFKKQIKIEISFGPD